MPSYFAILKAKLTNIVNVFIFLPFYFNFTTHLFHLFSPWKRLVGERHEKGFSLGDALNEWSMNMVSRSIGFFLRSFLIIEFLICYLLFILIVAPLWLVVALATTPLSYIWGQIFWPKEAEQKAKDLFLRTHLSDNNYLEGAEAWFKSYWEAKQAQKQTFSLDNLLTKAPLGRDWNFGFTPVLDDYTTDLTSNLTYKNRLIGRAKEISLIERALLKTQDANAILVGDEGVGKHTIVDGLAQNLLEGKVLPGLQNMRLLEINMEKVLAEKPSLEEKTDLLESLFQEAALAKNIVLVVSDFHKYISATLVGDFSSLFEKYASRPLIKLLALTTPFYYEQIVYHNDKLKNLFNKVEVKEIGKQEAVGILLTKALEFEKHYGVAILYEAVLQVVERSDYYITHIPFPEKAINLLDEVCVFVKGSSLANKGGTLLQVTPELVDQVLRERTHLPVGKLGTHLKDRLLNLEALLGAKVLGQAATLSHVGKAVRRSYLEERRKKPLVSLLFLGPTGVGKTQTAKELAKIFFGSPEHLLRFDMSFYQNKESLNDLIGSFDKKNPGLLANAIRENPYAVLLIDEIEKASRDLLNIFLTLLDEGYLVDGFGEKVDCKNLIVIATSNAASREIQAWVKEGRSYNEIETLVRDLVVNNGLFTPEFLNRFDKALVFEPLSPQTAYEIGYSVAKKTLAEYLEQKQLDIKVPPQNLRTWIDQSFKPENGAREIERVIRENIADLAATALLRP